MYLIQKIKKKNQKKKTRKNKKTRKKSTDFEGVFLSRKKHYQLPNNLNRLIEVLN